MYSRKHGGEGGRVTSTATSRPSCTLRYPAGGCVLVRNKSTKTACAGLVCGVLNPVSPLPVPAQHLALPQPLKAVQSLVCGRRRPASQLSPRRQPPPLPTARGWAHACQPVRRHGIASHSDSHHEGGLVTQLLNGRACSSSILWRWLRVERWSLSRGPRPWPPFWWWCKSCWSWRPASTTHARCAACALPVARRVAPVAVGRGVRSGSFAAVRHRPGPTPSLPRCLQGTIDTSARRKLSIISFSLLLPANNFYHIAKNVSADTITQYLPFAANTVLR